MKDLLSKEHYCHNVDAIPETDSGLVQLVRMTNVFFNHQQHEIKTKQFICVKQIMSSLFSNNGNQHFYSQYMLNVKTSLYRKLNFQSKLSSSASQVEVLGVKRFYEIYFEQKIYHDQLLTLPPNILRLVEVSRRT